MDPISLRAVGTLEMAYLNLILRAILLVLSVVSLLVWLVCVGCLGVSSEYLCTCNLGFWCYLGL